MKKLIAMLLAMMMVFAFAACGSSSEDEPEATEAVSTVEETEATEAEDATEETTTTAETTKAAESTTASYSVKAVNETVWVTSDVNVRSGADTSYDRVTTAKKGEKLQRTGVLSNGWSRVNYNGKDRYISSKYLTTKNPAKKSSESKTTKATKKTTTASTTAEPTSEEPTTEPTTESTTEETTTEEPTTEPTTAAPATVTDRGVVASCSSSTLKLDNGHSYDISNASVKFDVDNAEGLEVVVEYIEGTNKAIEAYPVNGAKAVGESSGSSMPTILIVLALIAIAIAAVIVIVRNKRKTA